MAGDQLLDDRIEVRIFTVADHAVVAPDGKLYVNGAGVDWVVVPGAPGALPPIWLAIRVRVPWNRTSERLLVRILALNADREPVAPGPPMQVEVEVGRPPGLRAGDENGFNLAVGLAGLPVPQAGSIYFHLEVDGKTLSVLPLKVLLPHQVPGAPVRP